MRARLEAAGHSVRMIGERGDYAELWHRTRDARGADFFVSIHHDSVKERLLPQADRFSGFSLFVSRSNPQVEKSLRCASVIGERLREGGFRPSRYHADPVLGEDRPFADETNGVHYFDNLAVVDRVLAEFEDRLERDGRWDDTALVVTSDHSLRTWLWQGEGAWTEEEERETGGQQSPHVPFVVKFAGRHEPLVYEKPFTIALLYDVVLAMADGEVTNPAELAAWLDANRGRHPTDVKAPQTAGVGGT